MRAVRAGLAAIWLLGGVNVAGAVCPGLDVLIEDSFDALAPAWGESDTTFSVEEGRLIAAPASGLDVWRQNNASLYDDIDMCITVTTLVGVEPTEAKAGAMFWFEDVNNFYVFQIAPNRMASVWRRQRGRWLEQIGWKRVDAANEGDGGVNELRVTAEGNAAKLYVNGSEFGTFEGTPPEKGALIGLFASSPESGRAVFAFDSLRVTKP